MFKRHPNDKADLKSYGFKDSYAGVFKTYEANRVVGKSKYDGVNLKAVAYWQIHPEEQGQLQLCDEDGQVLHTESVRTRKGERSLERGVLRILYNNMNYRFKRHPNDEADLEVHGFIKEISRTVLVYGANDFTKSLPSLTYEIVRLAVCWRIDPTRTGFIQLIGTDGSIVHVAEVMVRSRRKRKLRSGFLMLTTAAGKVVTFKRHPDDKADLEENGFNSEQTAKVLEYDKAPVIVEENAEEDRDTDAEVIEMLDESYTEMRNTELDEEWPVYKLLDEGVEMSDGLTVNECGDISVSEHSFDSESSDDELMIVE